MRTVVLLWLGVFICSSMTSAAVYELGEGEYGYGLVLRSDDSLLVNGGGASAVDAWDYSFVEVRYTSTPLGLDVGGINTLSLHDNSILNYYGGLTGILSLRGDAQTFLFGGSINAILSYQYVPMPNNIAYPRITIDCQLDSVVYDSQTNIVMGNWNNGELFSIQLYDQSGYDPVIENIEFVPEPMTLLLFGFGGFAIRRFVKRRQLK